MHPAGMSAMQGAVDRPGADFANFDLPTADPRLCQGECAVNGSCRAWTYVEPDPNHGTGPHCWIKSSIPASANNFCCVSGTK
jgi:hypothetical protein